MGFQSIGDISHDFMVSRRSVALKQQLTRLTEELSSGQTSDVTAHLSASFSHLADIERHLTLYGGVQVAVSEATLFTDAMETVLDRVRAGMSELAQSSVLTEGTPNPTLRVAAGAMAEGILDSMVSALNGTVAGRALFAGADVRGAALASTEALVAGARSAVAGSSDAGQFRAALDAYFGPGGGFETDIYLGAASHLAPYQLGDGETVAVEIKADNVALREVMKDVLTIQLLNDETLPMSEESRLSLLRGAGESLLTGDDRIAMLQSDVGAAQSRIAQSAARIAAQLTSLQFARAELTSVDPYTTAAELESTQLQLEMLYTVTVRSSRLTLMSFL